MNPIRSALRHVLAALGLASRRRVENLLEATSRAKSRSDKLRGQLATARTELRNVKGEVKRTAKAQAAAMSETDEAHTRAEKLTAKSAEWKRTADDWKRRAEEYRTRLREVQRKLKSVEQSTRLAHEHLMSVEVKLDLVDAAIRTLDDRTRTVLPNGPVIGTASSHSPSGESEGK